MSVSNLDCPFCQLDHRQVIAQNPGAFAILDRYPVSEGHALVISRTHAANLFDLQAVELKAVFQLLVKVQQILTERHTPDGFNVGANIGSAAGQTIMHAHLHVIPRFAGDVSDPTGGIRNVIPGKGKY
jgi:diadenosine tetraphosphate (Ap4A) HIT family hydrolase